MRNRSHLNINIYSKDELFYVRFDVLTQNLYISKIGLNQILSLANLSAFAEKFTNEPYTQSDMTNEESVISDKRILKHLLQMSPKEPRDINSLKAKLIANEIMINNIPFNHITITYLISNTPHVLINWLACYSKFINKANDLSMFEHVQFNDHSQFEIFNTTNSNNLFSEVNYKNGSVRMMMKNMLNFKDSLITYQDTFNYLAKIYKYYEESRKTSDAKPLLQCLSDKTRCELIYKDKIESLSLMNNIKEREFDALTSTLTKNITSKKLEFLFMLELLNSRDKINLIENCFGKRAHDNVKYRMDHTELQLLYFADFYLFSDGKMGIINLDKNPAYIEFYAEGKDNYHILTAEFVHLANCLGLEFEINCDFHKNKQMIFTADSSLKLADLGLHINTNYSKHLFNAYNKWAFYTKIRLAGDNIFRDIPEEIVDDIIVRANPSYQRFYNRQLHPGFFQAVQLGKEKGYQEHQEAARKLGVSFKLCK